MNLNQTPAAERPHIGFFFFRNAGKSSIVNAVTGQNLAVVSNVKGTTTDPVVKAMELLPAGPVVMIDTPGIDDDGELGKLRVEKSYQMLNRTDLAIVVIDGGTGIKKEDFALLKEIEKRKVPFIIAVNKSDLLKEHRIQSKGRGKVPEESLIYVSAETGEGIRELKKRIGESICTEKNKKRIVGDLLESGDVVVLVIPIDESAPKGRLILPQQQTIRDILESGAISVVTKEDRVKETIENLKIPPKLVITDSQVFEKVACNVLKEIKLTSFSILFARYKGNLRTNIEGVMMLDKLKNGDKILISEGCTHHRQCGDIGTVKIPKWIREYTGKELLFETTSGTEFPADLSPYKMVVHCGGCMLNEREMQIRLERSKGQKVPMTNYGILIAYTHGILKRSVEIFPEIAEQFRRESFTGKIL